MQSAPQAPNRLSLLWIGLAAGSAAGLWVLVVTSLIWGTSTPRQLVYLTVALSLSGLAARLTIRYCVQRARRDAWWDGFAAGDEPLADVVPLRAAPEHPVRFWESSPS